MYFCNYIYNNFYEKKQMKINKILLINLFLILLVAGKVSAVPAYPYFIQLNQPDGKEITVKMKGDEKMKWMESEDGYSLLYDKNKYIVFAEKNEKGDMIPSNVIARNAASRSDEVQKWLKGIPQNLQYSKNQKEILRGMWKIIPDGNLRSGNAPQSAVGTAKAICALIQFPNKSLTYTQDDFSVLMNQVGYENGIQKGSVRDFYLENSYGQLDMVVTVVGPYTVSHNDNYYGENKGSGIDSNLDEFSREAANFAFRDPNVNPADYDNDGDGYIDTFHFIFAGYGEESGAGDDCIWSHKSGYWPALQYGGKKLDTYSCSPELRGKSGTNISYIGVICHELCHVFGAPDYYDADGNESGGDFPGTGNWDLMANGSWNNSGATPAHINMFQKINFGWVNPIVLSSPQEIKDMPNSAENPVAYIIPSNNPNEYYVLENRQKNGFDAKVPGSGLLIYHVNYDARQFAENSVNNGHPQGVYPVFANSPYEIPSGTPASYGSINSSTCTFPITGIGKKVEFTDQSVPSAFLWSGGKLGKPITNITVSNQLASFYFMRSLLNLQAQVEANRITLIWVKPDSEKTIKGYNIYRNGQFILQTTNTTYRETVSEEGTYTYGVSILFEGEESAIEEVKALVKGTAIDAVAHDAILVYPNPVRAGEPFYLNLNENSGEAGLFFYTLSGQLVWQKQVNAPHSRHTVHLPAGMYIVKIKQERLVSTMRLIIK
jgi:M6 family metalloprotease-like protein